jgi:GNAT superfamily N-acetyltransferase
MADLAERGFDHGRDLLPLISLIGSARASSDPHAFLHPGGLQWLLRKLGDGGFAVRQWFDGDDLAGVVVDDSGYVIVQGATGVIDRHLWLLGQAEAQLRGSGQPRVEVSVWEDDRELLSSLQSLGYEPSGTYGRELVYDIVAMQPDPSLPDGFGMLSLEPSLDDAYIELHRAAWSTWVPSTYDRQMHAAVTTMPYFDRDFVAIAAGPDGTLAAYCIAWFDRRARTVEIEPLATHPKFRRLGLARAIVQEVLRRSAQRGAETVMVWGVNTNPVATHLYESAGFRRRRVLREYQREL